MKRLLVVLFTCLSVVSVTEAAYTTSAKVQIAGEMTNVYNLYYEILYQDKRIQEDIELELLNESGAVIDIVKTKDGIIDKEKVPLGDYFLRVKGTGQKFFIKADVEYVKTQHILKPLILDDNDTVQTGDHTLLCLYVVIFLVSSTVMCISVWRRRKNSE